MEDLEGESQKYRAPQTHSRVLCCNRLPSENSLHNIVASVYEGKISWFVETRESIRMPSDIAESSIHILLRKIIGKNGGNHDHPPT